MDRPDERRDEDRHDDRPDAGENPLGIGKANPPRDHVPSRGRRTVDDGETDRPSGAGEVQRSPGATGIDMGAGGTGTEIERD